MVFPNLIIIGAPRCGTSTLFTWLTSHPQVGGSNVKEAAYFIDEGTHLYNKNSNFQHHGLAGYAKYFRHIKKHNHCKWIVEATPTYLYSETALNNLGALETKPIFIIMLREPSEQIYSTYNYFSKNWNYLTGSISFKNFYDRISKGSTTLGENELLDDALKNAAYVAHVKKWVEKYGRDRILCYVFEDMRNNPAKFVRKLCKDLGIDESFYNDYPFPVVNQTYRVRSRLLQKLNVFMYMKLPKNRLYDWVRRLYRYINTHSETDYSSLDDKQLLHEIKKSYADDNRRLAKLLGIELTGWS